MFRFSNQDILKHPELQKGLEFGAVCVEKFCCTNVSVFFRSLESKLLPPEKTSKKWSAIAATVLKTRRASSFPENLSKTNFPSSKSANPRL